MSTYTLRLGLSNNTFHYKTDKQNLMKNIICFFNPKYYMSAQLTYNEKGTSSTVGPR